MTGDDAAFGALLRRMRLGASLTIEALAEASGVSVRGIGDLERGRRAAPQRRTVAALADGLGLGDAERERLLAAARAGRSPAYSPAGVRAFPRGIDDFVGRKQQLVRLAELAGRTEEATGRPVVAVVSGPPGTGKTTLALHAARGLAHLFPDGQLMVDLRGMDDAPPAPSELILGVLKALGVADRDLAKAGPSAHSELYRQTLAGRRCLLVLDNARDETQVRPLLPGAGAALVVVTSRRMLTGLESVHRLPLGELSTEEATAFLTAMVGSERAGSDPAGLAEVAHRCGHLPLALRVAGNWLATRTGWSVRRLTDRLDLEERRLASLTAGDVRVSAAFDLSYRQLTPSAARLFRLLSLLDGPDTSAACAAQLIGRPLFDTEDTLEELVEAGLLGADGDRYRFHDLLRLYARTRLEADEPAADATRARTAMHRWLLETAIVAGRWFEPDHGAPPATWQGTVDLSSAENARRWLQAEGPEWLAALRHTASAGEHRTVVAVAEAMHWFSDQWIFWGHWPEVFGTAASSAEALGDPLLEATHLNHHAWAMLVCEGRHHDSLTPSSQALAAARRSGDLVQEGWAHMYISWALRLLREYNPAVDHNTRAARLFEAAGDLTGSLQAKSGHGLALLHAGRAEEAIDVIARTLSFLDEAEDLLEPHIAEFTRTSEHSRLGDAYSLLECWDDAVAHLQTAVALSRDSGNTALESFHVTSLGKAHLAAGQPEQAYQAFLRCLSLADGNPRSTAEAREHLARLGSPPLPDPALAPPP
ncbi:ATP-binding protein [Streptomyces sp. NPDC102473]|uniref:ATP-binding protein n=1 Tax=Streptomyces sp. NPDC102473 TaxID=3366180 RepID=UPI003828A474